MCLVNRNRAIQHGWPRSTRLPFHVARGTCGVLSCSRKRELTPSCKGSGWFLILRYCGLSITANKQPNKKREKNLLCNGAHKICFYFSLSMRLSINCDCQSTSYERLDDPSRERALKLISALWGPHRRRLRLDASARRRRPCGAHRKWAHVRLA